MRRLTALLVPAMMLAVGLSQGPLQPTVAAAAPPAPTVTDMAPTDGPVNGGTVVYLFGSGFTSDGFTSDVTGVKFGGLSATVLGVDSDGQMRVQAPNSAVSVGGRGPNAVHVVVTTQGGSAQSPKDFVFHPEITALAPPAGLPSGHDHVVQVQGVGFQYRDGSNAVITSPTVCFGQNGSGNLKTCNTATVCPATSPNVACATQPAATDTAIYVDPPQAPNGQAGTVDVYVLVNGIRTDTNANTDGYTYVTPSASTAPTITNVMPTCCSQDNSVTITGTNFTGVDMVSFGNPGCGQSQDLAAFSVTGPQITATAPGHLAGTVDIGVHNGAGWSACSANDQYTYDVPAVTALSHDIGPTSGGTDVTIDGGVGSDDFNPADTRVDFGGTLACAGAGASKCSVTPTGSGGHQQVKTKSPAHKGGTVHVHVINSAGTSPDTSKDFFTYQAPQPTLTSLSPTSGTTSGGTSVTITGTGFTAADAYAVGDPTVVENRYQCSPANGCAVNGDTAVTLRTPAHSAGTVDLFIHTVGGWTAMTAGDHFTFVSPPHITSLSPASGSSTGGTPVTITGTDFTNANKVFFGQTGLNPCPATPHCFTVGSSSSITLTTPALDPGNYTVYVQTPAGGLSNAGTFDFGRSAGHQMLALNPDGRLEAFAVGGDHALYHSYEGAPSGGFSSWLSLGGGDGSGITFVGDPAVGRNADGHLEVFIVASNGNLYHVIQVPGAGWTSPANLGQPSAGALNGAPAVATNGDGRLEVFLRGANGEVWHIYQFNPNGDWSGWFSLGGPSSGAFVSDVAAGTNGDGRLEIGIIDGDGGLWHTWQAAPSSGWGSFFSLPLSGHPFEGNPGILTNQDGRLEFFARGVDKQLWHLWQVAPSSGWTAPSSLGNTMGGDPGIARNQDGRLEIFFLNAGGTLVHTWQVAPNTGWYQNGTAISLIDGDTTTFAGTPRAATNTDGTVDVLAQDASTDTIKENRQVSAGSGWASSWFDTGAGNAIGFLKYN